MVNHFGVWGFLKTACFYLLCIMEAAFSQPQSGKGDNASLVPGKGVGNAMSSALSVAEISSTLRKHSDQIGQCLEREKRSSRALLEQARASLVIDGDGSVASCQVTFVSMKNSILSGCLCGKIRTWKFPKPSGNQSVAVQSVPLTFVTKATFKKMSDSTKVMDLVQAIEKQIPFTADKLSRLLGIQWPPPNEASSPYFKVFEAVVSAGPYERFIHTAKLQIAGPEGSFENRLGLELETNVTLSEDDLFQIYDQPQLSVGSPHSTDSLDYIVIARPWGELAFGCRRGKHDRITSVNFSPATFKAAGKGDRDK
jgi:hypothetical protein